MTIKTHEEIVIAEFEPVLKLLDKVDEYITLNYDTGMSSRELGILKLRQALQSQRDIAVGRVEEVARHNINLILPLAKGYAREHKVGSNDKYISCVEDYLESLTNKQHHDKD